MEPHGHFPRHQQPYPPHQQQQQYPQQQQQHPYQRQHHHQQFQHHPSFPQPPIQQLQYQHQQQQQQQPFAQGLVIPDDPVYAALEAFALQHGDLGPADVRELEDILVQLMRDCSQANIQAGKSWIVQNCQNPPQYDNLARALVAVAITRTTFSDKLHIVYLVNDIISHSERNQQRWVKDAFLPHLVPLLRVAYFYPGIDDAQRQRVMKVLGIWRSAEYFPPHIIAAMELDVKRPPILPAGSIPGVGPSPQYHQQLPQAQPRQHPAGLPSPTPFASPGHPPTQPLDGNHGYPGAQLRQTSFPHQQGYHQSTPYQHSPPPLLNQSRPQHHDQNAHHQMPQPPPPPPPPAPTHRDAYTKELPAALMISKIEASMRSVNGNS
ncbi:hypothetical protein MVEG_09567 [Podila verticillata NRRL 6337]|nr:hypothetical protein MVEG_09567 [Podila verticillata NRRL 6337]